uniref:Mitofilin n=1 Tax=Peronospora matthiolae TaxID=2874970 RepID=A0AAV1TNQ4_9STRA
MWRQVLRTPAARLGPSTRTYSAPPLQTVNATKKTPLSDAKLPSGAKPVASAGDSSSAGASVVKKGLLLGLLSSPVAVALYVKQNEEWDPPLLRHDERWIKFRELVLGPAVVMGNEPVVAKRDLADDLSAAITRGQQDVEKEKQENKVMEEEEEKKRKKKEEVMEDEEKKKRKKMEGEKGKQEKKDKKDKKKKEKVKETDEKEKKGRKEKKKKSEKKGEKEVEKAEKKLEKAEHKAEKAMMKVEKLKEKVGGKKNVIGEVDDAAQKRGSEVKAVGATVAAAATAIGNKVDLATVKAREEIAKLSDEVSPEHLTHEMEKQIQATTNDLLSSLKAESEAATAEINGQYLAGIDELDADALAIRVAQLATEMKYRSKWEAVRLLESLRRMEEDAQKKSAEVLRRQDELHKELLARELRLQEELLSRQSREEMSALKKQYADDLARNVNEQRASLLSELQRTFARESKAIEARCAQQLESVTEKMQKTLADEREKRVQELQKYRAELRALGTVLDSSSTYEAFSHRVHKASMAALALSDRVEAAAPLRSEIRALRKAARSDPFIEAVVKSLPQDVIEHGAPSVGQLQERFKVVKSAGHRTALVPDQGGIMSQVLGTALSLLMIPPGGPIEGTDADAVLSRAEFALRAGDIEKAIVEMKGLSGLPAQVSQDWIAAAESRLAVEQTAKVIKAHVALLAASCS